jgi:hypothetical protein
MMSFVVSGGEKTKPIKAKIGHSKVGFINDSEDCHGLRTRNDNRSLVEKTKPIASLRPEIYALSIRSTPLGTPYGGSSKSEMTTFDKAKLKKQTQFVSGTNGASSYMKGDYGKIPLCGVRKNKANLSLREQSQFRFANSTAVGSRAENCRCR